MNKVVSTEVPRVRDPGDALYRTAQYLTKAEQNCDYESVHYFLDWDLLQEAIYPNRSASVYSPLVWCALECLEASSREGDDWKPYLPEGTRVELLRHLAKLASETEQSSLPTAKRSVEDAERMLGTLPAVWRRPDWKEVLVQFQKIHRAHEAIGLLYLIISRYAQPAPMFDKGDLLEEQQAYERRLDRLRTKATNAADAQNLASVALVSTAHKDPHSRIKATLVSASLTVWKASEATTADPFAFMVDAYYRRYQPDPSARRKLLRSLIADVYKLLNQVQFLHYQSSPHLMREETVDFLAELDTLDNVALQELGRLLSTATQSVYNAKAETQQFAADLWPEDLSALDDLTALKRKALLLRDRITPNALESGELEWKHTFQSDRVNRFGLVAGATDLLEAQTAAGGLTCTWPTRHSMSSVFDILLKAAKNIADLSCWSLGIRLANTVGLKEVSLELGDLSIATIAKIAGGRKIIFVRLVGGPLTVWYSLVNHGRRLEVSPSSNHHAKISIRIPMNEKNELICGLFEQTAYEWYYPTAVSIKLTELLNS